MTPLERDVSIGILVPMQKNKGIRRYILVISFRSISSTQKRCTEPRRRLLVLFGFMVSKVKDDIDESVGLGEGRMR